MPNFNQVTMIGHLTRDPEIKQTNSGTTLAKCGIATNHKRGDRENVCYLDFTVWGKSAEVFAKYLKKGGSVLIQGRLEYNTWETDDGQKRSKHELSVSEWTFVGGKGDGAETAPVGEAIPF